MNASGGWWRAFLRGLFGSHAGLLESLGLLMGATLLALLVPAQKLSAGLLVGAFASTLIVTHAIAVSVSRHSRASGFSHRVVTYPRRIVVLGAFAWIGLAVALEVWMQHQTVFLRTEENEHRRVRLPDASTVDLQPASALRVRYEVHERRINLHRGGARFGVAHDTVRPFCVVANRRVTRATGTLFDTELLTEKQVRILDVEGAVATFAGAPPSKPTLAVHLRPGWAGVFRTGADASCEDSWRSGILTFEQEDLDWVVDLLNLYGPRRYVLDDPTIADIGVVGQFDASDVTSLLNAFAALGVHSRTTSVDGIEQVHLYGEGGVAPVTNEPPHVVLLPLRTARDSSLDAVPTGPASEPSLR